MFLFHARPRKRFIRQQQCCSHTVDSCEKINLCIQFPYNPIQMKYEMMCQKKLRFYQINLKKWSLYNEAMTLPDSIISRTFLPFVK